MICENLDHAKQTEPNWIRIRNHLARKALAERVPLPRGELYSLAGLAVAQARDEYDPHRATKALGVWVCHAGWLCLLNLIREQIERRRREPPVVSFTDLGGRRATPQRTERRDYVLESTLASRRPAQSAPDWLGRLTREERRIVHKRAAGWTLKEVALAHGRSVGWVRWCLKRLRRRLADLAP